jgi:hypothetical protein
LLSGGYYDATVPLSMVRPKESSSLRTVAELVFGDEVNA